METLVFLPGTMLDGRVFAAQVRHFAAAGWRILTPDIRGNDGGIAEVAAGILQSTPPRFAVVGLSLGGIVALEMLRQQPGRISHLALLDTNDGGDSETARTRREDDYRRARQCGLPAFMLDEMIPRYLHQANRNNAAIVNSIGQMAEDAGMAVWRGQLDLLPSRRDNRGVLRRAAIPVLVGCGEDDGICPPALHRQMAKAAKTKAVIFPASGHLPTLENPAAVIGAVEALLHRRGG